LADIFAWFASVIINIANMHSVVLFLFIGVVFAEEDIICHPPKLIPDVDKAPMIYYSIDTQQCDKVLSTC